MKTFYILPIFWALSKYYLGFKSYKETIQDICVYLSKINIFYVKLFQWFTYDLTNEPDINRELYEFFTTFTNNVEYTKDDIDDKVIETFLSHVRNANHEIELDMTPINSGTVALVFKGTLDKKPVIVKVLRKNIHLGMNDFYNQIQYIQNIISWLKYLHLLPGKYIDYFENDMFTQLIGDCKDDFLLQTNFVNESKNIEEFYNAYQYCKYIQIPKVYAEYTEQFPEILVMDYIHSSTLNENTNEENEIYLEIIHKFIISSYFVKNTFHGDLHLGNILFIKTSENNENIYKLGIIDFGLVGKLNDVTEQNLIYDLLLCYSENNNKQIINTVITYIEEINQIKLSEENIANIIIMSDSLQIFQSNDGDSNTITHHDIILFLKCLKKCNIFIPKRLSFFLLSLASQAGSIHKLKENVKNIDLRLLISQITDSLL